MTDNPHAEADADPGAHGVPPAGGLVPLAGAKQQPATEKVDTISDLGCPLRVIAGIVRHVSFKDVAAYYRVTGEC